MAITVMLDRGSGDLTEHEADEAIEYLTAHGVWWRRTGPVVPGIRPVYQPSPAPHPQPSKREWTAQIVDEDSWSMGEAARREMLSE